MVFPFSVHFRRVVRKVTSCECRGAARLAEDTVTAVRRLGVELPRLVDPLAPKAAQQCICAANGTSRPQDAVLLVNPPVTNVRALGDLCTVCTEVPDDLRFAHYRTPPSHDWKCVSRRCSSAARSALTGTPSAVRFQLHPADVQVNTVVFLS